MYIFFLKIEYCMMTESILLGNIKSTIPSKKGVHQSVRLKKSIEAKKDDVAQIRTCKNGQNQQTSTIDTRGNKRNKSIKQSQPDVKLDIYSKLTFPSPNNPSTTTKNEARPSYCQKEVLVKNTFKVTRLLDKNLGNIEEVELLDVNTKYEDLFSEERFEELQCNPLLVACLKQRFNFETATKVQSLAIPALLNCKDALIKSATGSGKTLAYAIPMVQSLQAIEPKIGRTCGIHALIILPTRELALQTYDCLNLLLQPYRRLVLGLLIGGEKKKSEKARIRKGLNILIGTPGRLLDHLQHTSNLRLHKLKWLVVDEADRLYEQGFSAMIGQIIEYIQQSCLTPPQTVLLSATLSKGVKELAGLSLKDPEIVDVSDQKQRMEQITLPESLENCYMICPSKLRLVILSCILLKSLEQRSNGSKIIVFMSCQDVVDFFSILLNVTFNKILKSKNEVIILQLHGNMTQNDRTHAFKKFHEGKCGILFCTDVVSRGLDLSNVDLVVQMSVPPLVEDYVHRVGRTARVGSKGRSILILLTSEIKYVYHLQNQLSIGMNAIKVEQYFDSLGWINFENAELHTDQERLAHLHQIFEEEVYADENLHKLATKAFISHLRAYASYPHKMSYCLPFKELHLGHLAKSFALRESPSELGANFHRNHRCLRSNKKIKDTSSLKRRNIPLEDKVSEFGGMITKTKRIKKS